MDFDFVNRWSEPDSFRAQSVIGSFTLNDVKLQKHCIVGFASPPDWPKAYSCLSQGEKMRVDIARALCLNQELIVFDEFTSVVDREVAKIASFAISKAIRRDKTKQFIAVTCHYDVIDWLEPDWVFCTGILWCLIEKKSVAAR